MLRLPSSSSLLLSRSTCSRSLPLGRASTSASPLLPSSPCRSLSWRASPGSRPSSRSAPPRSGYGLQSSSSPRSSSLSSPRGTEEGPKKEKLWKHQQEITFSHGFVKKEFTPSPARQPPRQAPYGPGSGTASDPKVYLAIEQAQRRSQTLPSPPSHPSLSAPDPSASSFLPPPSSRQPSRQYESDRIDAPGFKPATSFTSGGFQRDASPTNPRNSPSSGSLRHASKIAKFEGPVLRGTVDGEELPRPEFIDDDQKRRAYLPTGPTNTSYGLSSLDSNEQHPRFQRNAGRDDVVDPNSVWGGGREDDAESAAWNDTSSFRNSDISVSIDNFTPSDLDPELLASIDKNEAFFPSPQPYSSGFNFSPIPGDVTPSSVVPANKIIPNFDPHSWDKLPVPQQAQVQQLAPLTSPRASELPRIVTSEWRGVEESRIKASKEGGAWKEADEATPFMAKKRRGDPSPLPSPSRRVQEIPHPSLTLHNPSSSNLVASSSSATSKSSLDPNDPTNRYSEVSSSDSFTGTSPYFSSDPLLQPWSYDAPLPPSLVPPSLPAPPPMIFKGAPRSPNATLPAWSLRKAAHLKQAYELNGDGTTHWKPTYKISREKMNEMRALAKEDPKRYHMKTLSEQFGLNPEAVRRILKSKWQEKDEWEWEVGGTGGERALEEGGKNSLEEDALSMAMSGGGEFELGFNRDGGELSGRGGRVGRKKLSEDDPFGDIDEVDEEEWFMSGGKEFEATTQSQEKEFLRKIALQEKGGEGEGRSSPSTKGRRKSLLTKLNNTPFGRQLSIPLPSSSLSEDATTTPPTSSSPPRRRHDARVADSSPWIIAPSTPSPDARQKFESQAAAARATIERARKVLEERKANKLRVFQPYPSTPAPSPSSAFSSHVPTPFPTSSPLSPLSSTSSSSSPKPTSSSSSSSFGLTREASRDAKQWVAPSALPRQAPSSSSSSSSSPPSFSKTSKGGSGSGNDKEFGLSSTPRWEKREEAGTWGSSTPKDSKGGESKPAGGGGGGTDVDSLFG